MASSGNYRVTVRPSVIRTIRAFPRDVVRRVDAVILSFEQEPRPPGVKRLAVKGGWRVRVGDCRILYTIHDATRMVAVYQVGHRKDVYRR